MITSTNKYRIGISYYAPAAYVLLCYYSLPYPQVFSILQLNSLSDSLTIPYPFLFCLYSARYLSSVFNFTKTNILILAIIIFSSALVVLPKYPPAYHFIIWIAYAFSLSRIMLGVFLFRIKCSMQRILRCFAVIEIIKAPTFLIAFAIIKYVFLIPLLNVASDFVLAYFFYKLIVHVEEINTIENE